jgi:aldose 1-epimerase
MRPNMSSIVLDNQQLRAYIDPEQGASVMALYAAKDDAWLPLMPDTRTGDLALSCASFIMVPYSNRIEGGTFTFQGQRYQLAGAAHHAIHGDVRSRPWTVEGGTSEQIRCSFRSAEHSEVNWPWPFEARAEYTVQENVFSSRLMLWNRGDFPMPAGFGWHPYFSRMLTQEGEPVHLCFHVAAVYPDANDNRIPSGPAQQLASEQDFSGERPLRPEQFLDACFQGYNGDGYIRWPESGVKLAFGCSSACTHLVMYNPTGVPYFAVEPVTNANNGINLLAAGEPESGVVILSPGERLEARFDLSLELA